MGQEVLVVEVKKMVKKIEEVKKEDEEEEDDGARGVGIGSEERR